MSEVSGADGPPARLVAQGGQEKRELTGRPLGAAAEPAKGTPTTGKGGNLAALNYQQLADRTGDKSDPAALIGRHLPKALVEPSQSLSGEPGKENKQPDRRGPPSELEKPNSSDSDEDEAAEERRKFLHHDDDHEAEPRGEGASLRDLGERKQTGGGGQGRPPASGPGPSKGRALLARQESTFTEAPQQQQQEGEAEEQAEISSEPKQSKSKSKDEKRQEGRRGRAGDERRPSGERSSPAEEPTCCSRMFHFLRAHKFLLVLLILVVYSVAIYSLPFLRVEPEVPNPLPSIPFDFNEGPLRPASASAFKIAHLFRGQVHGPESLAFDSHGNCFLAIEGGFVLYAHLNKSAPVANKFQRGNQAADLVLVAQLNGLRQATGPTGSSKIKRRRDNNKRNERRPIPPGWRLECQLDEQIYGPDLFEMVASGPGGSGPLSFKSNVRVSRCSKPLGVRLSEDESSLYVIDTLSGLYRVDLKLDSDDDWARFGQSTAPMTSQRVRKLIDFRANNGHQVLPAIQLGPGEDSEPTPSGALRATRLMNVSLKALDDLVIERGQTPGQDFIYMTVASQQWPAVSFLYDALEGRPSGLVVRYDTSTNLLAVLEPNQLAHVRTSIVLDAEAAGESNRSLLLAAGRHNKHQPSILLGAPRLDENDVFDDRPLNFPNGLELTPDGQALLIADTSNKRILKHYLRGPRRGTSDLWAWTPMFPDNIRRGYDKQSETYWVVGCGKSPVGGGGALASSLQSADMFTLLRTWPRLRKFILKNIYFFGYLIELMGAKVLKSSSVQDFGYELRTGSSLCSSGCSGMMIIQYDKWGDIIRSVHSREFPNDLFYFSQVNELMDQQTGEHSLYLGSPSYNYLTKLVLPSQPGVPTEPPLNRNQVGPGRADSSHNEIEYR